MNECFKPVKQSLSKPKIPSSLKKIWARNDVMIASAFIAIPIIIALLYNYSIDCKTTYYITAYNPKSHLCYTQSAVTEESILEQMLKYNYSVQLTDTNTLELVPAFYNFGLGIYYKFLPFVSASGNIIHIVDIPSYISTSYQDYTIIINEFGFQTGGIYIPTSSWNAQLNSMRISKFVLNTKPSYQIPIRLVKQAETNFTADLIVTYNSNCAEQAMLSGTLKISGMVFSDNICIYLLGANEFINTIEEYCQTFDCGVLVEYANDITALLKNDLENNVFSINPITYALPDHCESTRCIGLPLFQVMLLCISVISSSYVACKFFKHLYKKRNNNIKSMNHNSSLQTNNSIEMRDTTNTNTNV